MPKHEKQYELLHKLNLMPEHPTPIFPLDELQAFVQHHFSRRDHYLQVIENHPAPIYLQESAILKSRAAQLRQAFEDLLPAATFYYAVKSNNHPDVARVMLEAGFGLDVSSGLELETALSIGARDIVFSGPGKTEAELQLAVAHADRVIILMDSPGELHRLENIAEKADRNVRCGVRLTVNPKGLWRKFGIVPQALSSFWDEVCRCRHVRLLGLQFHTSWNLAPDPQIEFIRTLGSVLAEMPPEFISRMEFIDIGGGYWPAWGEWLQPAGTPEGKILEALGQQTEPAEAHYRLPAVGIEEFAERLSAAIHQHLFTITSCRICLEPGRWICNDAVQLLFSVVDKKAPDLVITDAGTNAVGWERFETDYFPILNLTRPAMQEQSCHVLGSLCTPHDVWGYAYWGADIQPGDVLMIPNQGAYTYSLRQNFIKPLPQVVTI